MEKTGPQDVDRRIREGGYDQEGLGQDYLAAIELNPEWQKDIEDFLELIPKKIELESGAKRLEEATVLDVGSGPGVIVDKIKDRVKKVIALDRAAAMVSHVAKTHEEENVEAVRGDFTAIPLADESVDLVLSAGTVYEIPVRKDNKEGSEMSPEQIEDEFLSEHLRVLKPGGVCILNGVSNAENNYVSRKFDEKRAENIQDALASKGEMGSRRNYVFLGSELEARLARLGYKCKVEFPNGKDYKQLCDAKITLLEKLN